MKTHTARYTSFHRPNSKILTLLFTLSMFIALLAATPLAAAATQNTVWRGSESGYLWSSRVNDGTGQSCPTDACAGYKGCYDPAEPFRGNDPFGGTTASWICADTANSPAGLALYRCGIDGNGWPNHRDDTLYDTASKTNWCCTLYNEAAGNYVFTAGSCDALEWSCDQEIEVNLDVVGKGCFNNWPTQMSNLVNVDEAGVYKVLARVTRSVPPQLQPKEEFRLIVNSNQYGPNVPDNADPSQIVRNQEAGTFSFIKGTNNVTMNTTALCPPSTTPNSVAVTRLCLVKQEAKLKVVKYVINDNGGTKQVSDFTLRVDGTAVVSGETNTVAPGAHTVSEDQLNGYTGVIGGDCDAQGHVTLAAGQTKTCTITNNDKPAYLKVVKYVINDDGGTKQVSDFTLYINTTQVASGANNQVNAGTYLVHEDQLEGYTGVIGGDCTSNGLVTLALGQSKVCTITNNDEHNEPQPSYLKITKIVINNNGGSAVPGDFTLYANGNLFASGVNTQVSPDQYTVSEDALAGYAFVSFGGDCDSQGHVTVGEGQSKHCTITNDDVPVPPQPAYLTVMKNVINDNGGTATAGDFTLYVNVTHVTHGVANLLAPGTYLVHEDQLAGYSLVGVSGDCNQNGIVTLAAGQNKTCIITNNDEPPTRLKVKKVVINDDGGTATVGDFTLYINTTQVTSGVFNTVQPGTYLVHEDQLLGYNGTISGDCTADGLVTLTLGQSKTCTITNNDIPPPPQPAHLKVTKIVINDDGGSAAVADFDLFVNGDQVQSGVNNEVAPGAYTITENELAGYTFAGFTGDCDSEGHVSVLAGESKHCILTNNDNPSEPDPAFLTVTKIVINDDGGTAQISDFLLYVNGQIVASGEENEYEPGAYTVSEASLPGYSGMFSGDCNSNGQVTLVPGDHKECIITNDDVACPVEQSTLTVIKIVINDDGGTATVGDFTLYIDGDQTTSGFAMHVEPGEHDVSEVENPDYTSFISGDCAPDGSVDVGVGEHKTCVIVNNDIPSEPEPAHLTVTKIVVNDDGGTAQVSDFPLYVDGDQVISGVENEVAAGMHLVSEDELDGYAFVGYSGDCNSNGQVTVLAGESKECILINNDIPPPPSYLKVTKIVINDDGGTAQVSDFTLYVEGDEVTSGVNNLVAPGEYTVSEDSLEGYAGSIGGDCDSNGEVIVGLGESKHCIITNNDVPPERATLTVTKIVVNDDGGTAVAGDFTLYVDANEVQSGIASELDAGTYTVSEDELAGYTFEGFSGDCDSDGEVTLAPGDDKHCTLTNNDIPPPPSHLKVTKVVINDDGGTLTEDDFTLYVDQVEVTSGVDNEVLPGEYTVSEDYMSGYLGSIGGDCASDGSVAVGVGESKHCIITNNDIPGNLTVTKIVINDNGGTKQIADFTLYIDSDVVTSGVVNTIDAGEHTVSEDEDPGYSSLISGDCAADGSVFVGLGQNKHCTITNNDRDVCDPGDMTTHTQTQGGWGAPANGNNPGTYRDANFAAAFPSGARIGRVDGDSALFTTSAAVENFLPAGGTPDALGQDYVNPASTDAGVLAGQTLALTLNVVFDAHDPNFGESVQPLGTFIVGTGVCQGMTVQEVLDEANTVLAGKASLFSPSQINDCAALINENFVDGTSDNGDLEPSDECVENETARLTVTKIVINDDGGSAIVADFTLYVNGDEVQSGADNEVDPGTYTVSEDELEGYSFVGFSGDCDENGEVTLLPTEEKECILTNDDLPPRPAFLTVTKIVINNNGGSAVAGDFTLYVNGDEVQSGIAQELSAGEYIASEDALAGYQFVGITGDCASDGSVTLAPGDDKQCFITNDDLPGNLTVTKIVVNDNGGSALAGDFALYIDGDATFSGETHSVDAGEHNVSEDALAGYAFVGFGGDCDSNGKVTVGLGESKQCTITNDDLPGNLTVTKIVINDNGGDALVSDFPLFVGDEQVVSGETNSVDAGDYEVFEQGMFGYVGVIGGDCAADGSVVVGVGESKHCTITNDDVPGDLTVTKIVINDDGGIATAGDFSLFIDATHVVSGETNSVDAGTYTVSEEELAGYALVGITGDCAADGSVTVGLNESKACVLTNDDLIQGCTYTQGYWKTHSASGPAGPYDDGWQHVGPDEEHTQFFLSGQSWIQVYNTPVNGNAYYALAHQWMAAWLNVQDGASATQAVNDALTQGEALFAAYTPAQIAADASLFAQANALAGTLDAYNNGLIGPGHCDDEASLMSVATTSTTSVRRSSGSSGGGSIFPSVSKEEAAEIIVQEHEQKEQEAVQTTSEPVRAPAPQASAVAQERVASVTTPAAERVAQVAVQRGLSEENVVALKQMLAQQRTQAPALETLAASEQQVVERKDALNRAPVFTGLG